MFAGNDVGSFLRAARARSAITRRQLAERVGYSVSWIEQVETNRHVPPRAAMGTIAEALGLSSWETHYLYALGGRMQTDNTLPLPDVRTYLQALNPHPAAWMSAAWTVEEANDEFMRLFKGVWITPNLVHWHYHSTKALDVIQNWTSTSEWCVGLLRFGLAVSPEDAGLQSVVRSLLPIKVFQRQWDSQVIPVDPATRPWVIRDLDTGETLTLDMRAWRTSVQSGVLLLGAVTGRQAS
ncbi:helix-turn-helix domain-containing protein [Mycobacteriaceae bacterium NPDC060252]